MGRAEPASARHWAWSNGTFNGAPRHGKPADHIEAVAFEPVRRIAEISDISRNINSLKPKSRREARSRLSAPRRTDPEAWLRSEPARMSRHNPVAKAINTRFETDRWPAFTRHLTDGRVCLTHNAAGRSRRGTAPGRKAWRCAGSDRGGNRTACRYSLIANAQINDIDPQARRADVRARMPAPECPP